MPIESPKAAALSQAREHGLWGRADSPPDWQRTLEGSSAGDPILVKDPTDPRDDFYLVPIISSDPTSYRSAWIMLDAESLKLREAALLDHWKAPLFPTDHEKQKISQATILLPDGTSCRFPENDLTPNRNNLVWRASDASILPYWPLKEWTAPHPVTREPVSIYLTQEGEILTSFVDGSTSTMPGKPKNPRRFPWIRFGLVFLIGLLAGIVYQARWHSPRRPVVMDPNFRAGEIDDLTRRLDLAQGRLKEKEMEIQRLLKRNKFREFEGGGPDLPDPPGPGTTPRLPSDEERDSSKPSPILDRP